MPLLPRARAPACRPCIRVSVPLRARRPLQVKRRWRGYPAASHLEDGDLLLSIDGKAVRTFREVEEATSPPPQWLKKLRERRATAANTAKTAAAPTTSVSAAPGAGASASDAPAAATATAAAAVLAFPGSKVWANPAAEARAAAEAEAAAAKAAAAAAAKASAEAEAEATAEAAAEAASAAKAAAASVQMEVLRAGKKVSIAVPTRAVGSDETRKVLLWAGAVLQAPPDAVARQRGLPPRGVYVGSHSLGSPAHKFKLAPTSRITEVDGKAVADLDAFAAAVAAKGHGDVVRLKVEDLRGVGSVAALKLDLTYFPTYEVCRGETEAGASAAGGGSGSAAQQQQPQWRRRLISPAAPKVSTWGRLEA